MNAWTSDFTFTLMNNPVTVGHSLLQVKRVACFIVFGGHICVTEAVTCFDFFFLDAVYKFYFLLSDGQKITKMLQANSLI